ncbi:Aste57867_14652 [Aphanomyces stellatus]|uniref:Histone-lysine N-methyltransferase, H3 lysine-79 specific n=1 Tax=Aphanomyces stellatus TaxID=120398 RepID=A0A485L217_9STRA|nr:hypothetical protein As57867_014597 [Aphanomyces stellatus]VFT91471.1 Aste57867_14652 [Aphanomyces stellatus]
MEARGATFVVDLTGPDKANPPRPPVTIELTQGNDHGARVRRSLPVTIDLVRGEKRVFGPPVMIDLTSNRNGLKLDRDEALELMEEAYAEMDDDDRAMYQIPPRQHVMKLDLSDYIRRTTTDEMRKLLTYGEIDVESFSVKLIPLLQLTKYDVFYDLGCGGGKAVLQVALETPCCVSKGMELLPGRVRVGALALERLRAKCPHVFANKTVVIVEGDILRPPQVANLVDGTVVFINDFVFPESLMHAIMDKLRRMPNLKRLVVTKELCPRHRSNNCFRNKRACSIFAHPPDVVDVSKTWGGNKLQIFVYKRVVTADVDLT